jgi:restriction system protein
LVIPSAIDLRIAFLKLLSDQSEHSLDQTKDNLAKSFKVSEDEKKKVFNNRQQQRRVFDTRVVQAISYLRDQGLIENKKRAVFKITKAGLNKLKEDSKDI